MSNNIGNESPSRWNKSTYLDKKLIERRQMENFIHDPSKRYAYNYRAEELETLRNQSYPLSHDKKNGSGEYSTSSTSSIMPLVKTSKKVEEMPNSCKLMNAKPWNFDANYSGQSLLASKAMHKVNSEKTLNAIEWCKARQENLLTNYVDPTQSTTILQNSIRDMKRDGNFKSQLSLGCRTTSLHSSHLDSTSSLVTSSSSPYSPSPTKDNDVNNDNNNHRSNTALSLSRCDSTMNYSISNAKKMSKSRRDIHTSGTFNHSTGRDGMDNSNTWGNSSNNNNHNDMSCKSIYSTTSSIPPAICHYSNRKSSRIIKTTKHSGVWEFNESEQKYMWSDTGSFVYDSPGDIVIKTDLNAYNYVDSTMKYTVHTLT